MAGYLESGKLNTKQHSIASDAIAIILGKIFVMNHHNILRMLLRGSDRWDAH